MHAQSVRGLYFVTAERPDRGITHAGAARMAILGGARVVQYREKARGRADYVKAAREVQSVCQEHGAFFVVNDDPWLAMELRADGLHVGQSDLDALSLWQPRWDAVVGISVGSADEVPSALRAGADYLGAGPVFATDSKPDADPPMGLGGLRSICDVSSVPVVAIGGIDATRVRPVLACGASAVCVISAVVDRAEPSRAAEELVRLSEEGTAETQPPPKGEGSS